jgi:hypothetical protein
MSYRRAKAAPWNARTSSLDEGRAVAVTVLEGVLAKTTLGGLPGTLFPGFEHDGLRYNILEVSVPTIRMTRDVCITRSVFYLVRDIKPDDCSDMPELFVSSTPKVSLVIAGEGLYTESLERARAEFRRLRKRVVCSGTVVQPRVRERAKTPAGAG